MSDTPFPKLLELGWIGNPGNALSKLLGKKVAVETNLH
jgi:hypothetical protein